MDKLRAPEYSIHPHPSNPELCIIRFHAGPPYEDIAFVVVNREWDHSDRAGFKSSFERGVFRLHFNFKRLRYRR